jgi:hypothetical protein
MKILYNKNIKIITHLHLPPSKVLVKRGRFGGIFEMFLFDAWG